MSVSADWTRPEAQHAGDASAYADDRKKSKKQLLQELVELRERARASEAADHQHASVEIYTKNTTLGLRELVAVSPAIIYTTKASGNYACTFVSDNLRHIMGYSPIEMITDPKCWPDHLHPDDAPRVLKEVGPLIERGGGTVEYRSTFGFRTLSESSPTKQAGHANSWAPGRTSLSASSSRLN